MKQPQVLSHVATNLPAILSGGGSTLPAIEKLQPSEMVIVESSKGTRIRDLEIRERMEFAQNLTKVANIRLGYNTKSAEELGIVHNFILNDLGKFQELTKAEISTALDFALDGGWIKKGDEVINFSSASFCQWVRRWIDEKKKPVMAKWSQYLQQQKTDQPELSLAEKRAIMIQCINLHCDQKESSLEFLDVSFQLWEGCEEYQLAVMTPERKLEIWTEVKEENPDENEDDLREFCKKVAYNEMIDDLIAKGCRLGSDGSLIPIPS